MAFAREHGAGPEEEAALALAVSEAATNAVLHAFVGMPAGEVCVTAEAGPGELRVSVCDDGRGMQPRTDSPGLGLGLPTIGRLTTRMDVRAGADGRGTEVAMTFRAPGVEGPESETEEARALRLLAAAGELGEAAGGWHGLGVERLADLLVGELADVVTVDVLGEDGPFRRLAGRVAGDDEMAAWLTSNHPVEHPRSPFFGALRSGRPALVDLDGDAPEPSGEPEAEARRRAERLGLHWFLAVPLPAGRRVLGVVGLGGRQDRPRPDEPTIELVAELARRAAAGLAEARVLAQLQRSQRRFEHILGLLREAVTVTDAEGRVLFANAAAAELLGVRTVADVLGAEPGALAARFAVTQEDGTPLRVERLPGRQALAGDTPEPLVLRSVDRATGRVRWTRTTAGLLEEDGRQLAVNVIEDVTTAIESRRRLRLLAAAGEALGGERAPADVLDRLASLVVPDLADWCAIRLRSGQEATSGGGRPTGVDGRRVLEVPVRSAGRDLGTLELVHGPSGRTFVPADAETAGDLAGRLGQALAARGAG